MQKLGHFAVDCQEMMPREVQKTFDSEHFQGPLLDDQNGGVSGHKA